MEFALPLIAIPAVIALIFKAAVYVYTRLSGVGHRIATRLFLMALLVFAIENVAEIVAFYRLNIGNTIPYIEATLIFLTIVIGFTLLFHLTLVLAFDERSRPRKILPKIVYSIAIVESALFIFTPWLVRDYAVLNYGIGYTATRIPGPLYILFELYAAALLTGIVVVPFYGFGKENPLEKRMQNRVLLIAIIPTVVLGFAVILLLHFGIRWFNISMTLPIAITYFLIVTAYAIHNHRFLDPKFSKLEFTRLQDELAEVKSKLEELRKHMPSHDDGATVTLNERVAHLETRLISMALEQCRGNKAKAAAVLGLRPNTLHYKIGRYRLGREKDETDASA